METQILAFQPVPFCQSLFCEANSIAKKRLGQEPIPQHVQMSDLLTAFRELRREDFTEHFGLTVGDWNESMAIIKTYLAASDPKTKSALHPDLGHSLGTIIEQWIHFSELPKDIRDKIKKVKQQFSQQEDALHERLTHFFNETKVRSTSLDTPEKDGVLSLIALYQPQVRDACHKNNLDLVFSSLEQFKGDLERLAKQAKEPSRPIQTLLTKTKKDLQELSSFQKKGQKKKKSP